MLKRIRIEDSVTGGHGEVVTNVDCVDKLRDFLKAYANARDVNNDEGKRFCFSIASLIPRTALRTCWTCLGSALRINQTIFLRL